MKQIKYILLSLLVVIGFLACDRSDPSDEIGYLPTSDSDGSNNDSDNAAINARIEELATKYDVLIRPRFSSDEIGYNWTSTVYLTAFPYDAADMDYVLPFLDVLEEVFELFPEGFIKKYMQTQILLCSNLRHNWRYVVDNINGIPAVKQETPFDALITNTLVVLTDVGPEMDRMSRQQLKEKLTSVLVERMMMNTTGWPAPDDFKAVSYAYHKKSIISTTYGIYAEVAPTSPPAILAYWANGTLSAATTNTPEGFVDDIEGSITQERCPWIQIGIFRPSRFEYYYRYLSPTGTYFGYMGCPRVEQDFADYVAFILNRTAAEKEAYYTYLRSKPEAFFISKASASYLPKDITIDKTIGFFKQKIQLVQDYFRQNFDVTLQEPH